MLNLLDVFPSLPIWNECFICYCFECLYMFDLKSVQLKCTLNIVLCFFFVFFFFMRALSIDKKGCSDKRYTVVHHLGYKVHHQAQHQAHLSDMVLHEKIYSLR